MAFKLNNVVPWGRSFSEYVDMFALTDRDLENSILGCGDGPASFNTEVTARGGRVISIDPLYQFTRDEIRGRIDEVADTVTRQLEMNRDSFVWDRFSSPAQLRDERLSTMDRFLADYEKGVGQGRYVEGSLPDLPVDAGSVDLALCSHFLFLYGEHLSFEFHVQSILELCRVAAEVRIFPLLELDGKPSRYLEAVSGEIHRRGGVFNVENVAYEFQKGGNQMARIQLCASR